MKAKSLRNAFACIGVWMLIVSPASGGSFSPSDLQFSFLGLSGAPPLILHDGSSNSDVTIDHSYQVPYGSTFDIIASLTNISTNPISVAVSNPPTAIPPTTADVIISGYFAGMQPVNAYFNSTVLTFAFGGTIAPFGGNGSLFTLQPGETATTPWGTFTSNGSLVPTGSLDTVAFAFTSAAITGGWLTPNDGLQPVKFDDPFYVTFTQPSPVPLHPSIVSQITGLGVFGLLAWWRRKRKATSTGADNPLHR